MNDEEIASLLRSQSPLVIIEAPAGCGKTYQASAYARDISSQLKRGKVLVLTHTHAACSVFSERTQKHQSKVEIRTLDSMLNMLATAYRISLGLPEDVAGWARQNGYDILAQKVVHLLRLNPMICRQLAKLFPVVICDEHQDSGSAQENGSQYAQVNEDHR